MEIYLKLLLEHIFQKYHKKHKLAVKATLSLISLKQFVILQLFKV